MIRQAITQIGNKVKIGVVGAPFHYGQPRSGVKEGPALIRKTGFIERLREIGHDVIDSGDLYPSKELLPDIGPSGEKNHNIVMTYNEALAEAVQEIRAENRLSIMLGGDHSTAIGSISGHCQGTPDKQVVVLWVDAHADINTGRTSLTGNMHGTVTSYFLHELRNKVNRIPGSEWPKPWLDTSHLVYLGLRDIDIMEQRLLDDLNVLHFSMRTIDKLGLSEVIARCFDKLQVGDTKSLHLSFDIDALDPIEAPCTGTPVRGGFTLREGLSIVEAAQATGRLCGLDLVEVNPTLGTPADMQITAQAARTILLGAVTGVRA